ncbi:MAG TPA: hypothetical protein VGG98_09415 [Solirubrobacteraceae bacterium]
MIAGYAAPYEPPRDPAPEQHIDVERPGELVGIDCFYVGRLKGTDGAIWQLTAIDIASSYAWAELVICKGGNPTGRQTSKLARRVAQELKDAGWQLERLLSDNGNRPQTNGNVEALHNDECWRPAFARYLHPRYGGLKRELDTYLGFYTTTARRGLSRLRGYPGSSHEQVRASWFAVGTGRAVVSHESALELHELSDVLPNTVLLLVDHRHRAS